MEKKTSLEFALYRLERAKEEIFPRQIGRKIVLASKVREDSDYDEEYKPNPEITLSQIQTAKELIQLVEVYLKTNRKKSFTQK